MFKNLNEYIMTFENIVDHETCTKIISQIDQQKDWETHTFYNNVDGSKKNLSQEKEFEVVFSDSGVEKYLMDKIWQSFYNYILELSYPWFNSWSGFTIPRFNRYKENTLMANHCDHIHSMFDGERKGIPIISALGSLNDNYGGGKLVFFDDHEIDMPAGSITVFPSNFMFPHRVTEITEGTRYTYVSWAW